MGDGSSRHRRSVTDLSVTELRNFVRSTLQVLYGRWHPTDRVVILDPDADWEVDHLDDIADLLEYYGLRPEVTTIMSKDMYTEAEESC